MADNHTAMELTAHDIYAEDDTRLRLWETTPDTDQTAAVVFVHGAITNSRALFAPPLADSSYSWLGATAATGRTAYGLDIRGYGDSEQPSILDAPPEENPPAVRAPEAAMDIRAALEFAAARHRQVHLVGVSWGTMTSGRYLETDAVGVESYTAVAPVYKPEYDFTLVKQALGIDGELGAYMTETREDAAQRMGGDGSPLFEAIWEAQAGSNQGIDGADAYKGPLGAFADTIDCCQGDPPYEAPEIDVPTFVVRGTVDQISQREDALTLYEELETPYKEYTEIGGADHYIMHGPAREQLYAAVNAFHERIAGGHEP